MQGNNPTLLAFLLETVIPNNGDFLKPVTLLGSLSSVALWIFFCGVTEALHMPFDFSDSYLHLDFSCL